MTSWSFYGQLPRPRQDPHHVGNMIASPFSVSGVPDMHHVTLREAHLSLPEAFEVHSQTTVVEACTAWTQPSRFPTGRRKYLDFSKTCLTSRQCRAQLQDLGASLVSTIEFARGCGAFLHRQELEIICLISITCHRTLDTCLSYISHSGENVQVLKLCILTPYRLYSCCRYY